MKVSEGFELKLKGGMQKSYLGLGDSTQLLFVEPGSGTEAW